MNDITESMPTLRNKYYSHKVQTA